MSELAIVHITNKGDSGILRDWNSGAVFSKIPIIKIRTDLVEETNLGCCASLDIILYLVS